jgi:hypothetical protein
MDGLDKAIQQTLLPKVLGRCLEDWELELTQFGVKSGGLGVKCPSVAAGEAFMTSAEGTVNLVAALRSGTKVDVDAHDELLKKVQQEKRARRVEVENLRAKDIVSGLPKRSRRALERVLKENISGWLTVGSSRHEGFDLSAQQFRDRLNLRYGQQLKGLLLHCDGCGENNSLEHALSCKKGGNVKLGHDQMRDECAQLAQLAYGNVKVEPFLRDSSGKMSSKDLRADFMVYGFWERQRAAFFDNRISDADAPSHFAHNSSYETVMRAAAQEKKRLYKDACEDLAGSFTPLVCTVDGVFHREFIAFQKRVASALASKWSRSYAVVMNWVRVRLQMALIRAVDLRLRGSRKKFHGVGFADGAGLGLVFM